MMQCRTANSNTTAARSSCWDQAVAVNNTFASSIVQFKGSSFQCSCCGVPFETCYLYEYGGGGYSSSERSSSAALGATFAGRAASSCWGSLPPPSNPNKLPKGHLSSRLQVVVVIFSMFLMTAASLIWMGTRVMGETTWGLRCSGVWHEVAADGLGRGGVGLGTCDKVFWGWSRSS